MASLRVSEVRLMPAADTRSGLLGFVAFVLNEALRVDGVALRRTADGRLVLSFPARRDRKGQDHPILRPLGDQARESIERQIFEALGLAEVAR
ncbi:MAG: septation protein SpoVG family protein [Planctomycetes bacterium]|nr:septation protein SpoVG family protein [Planctomycetota bacterium]